MKDADRDATIERWAENWDRLCHEVSGRPGPSWIEHFQTKDLVTLTEADEIAAQLSAERTGNRWTAERRSLRDRQDVQAEVALWWGRETAWPRESRPCRVVQVEGRA